MSSSRLRSSRSPLPHQQDANTSEGSGADVAPAPSGGGHTPPRPREFDRFPDPETLHRQVVGALRSAIAAHGAVDGPLIQSAAERIVAQVGGLVRDPSWSPSLPVGLTVAQKQALAAVHGTLGLIADGRTGAARLRAEVAANTLREAFESAAVSEVTDTADPRVRGGNRLPTMPAPGKSDRWRPMMAKLDPPLLTRGPVSGRVYVVTHGKVTGHDDEGRQRVEASVKFDVTDQFDALVREATDTEEGDDGNQ